MNNPGPLSIMFACAIALTACSESTAPPASTPEPSSAATPTAAADDPTASPAQPTTSFAQELRNAQYAIDTTSSGKATLRDGVFEESVAVSGGRNAVQLGPELAFGDLDGDGIEDAAVTLLASPGGSGSFTYVSAVLNENGAASPTGSVLIGDRITVQSLRIVDGKIGVTWLDRKPGEPMSAVPATRVSKTLAVQDGRLVAVAGSRAVAYQGIEQLRGHYTWGAEVESFTPCGSKQSFWIVGDKALLQPLRDRSVALAQARGKPYQPIYIEASGVSEGKATDGFAMDYDAVFRLDAVQTVRDASPAGCMPGS